MHKHPRPIHKILFCPYYYKNFITFCPSHKNKVCANTFCGNSCTGTTLREEEGEKEEDGTLGERWYRQRDEQKMLWKGNEKKKKWEEKEEEKGKEKVGGKEKKMTRRLRAGGPLRHR